MNYPETILESQVILFFKMMKAVQASIILAMMNRKKLHSILYRTLWFEKPSEELKDSKRHILNGPVHY